MRLLTRSDFDGLICGTILKEVGVIDCWKFVHPKDIQDGIVEVTDNDVLCNVPYVEGCKMWFDHHSSESERLGNSAHFVGESRLAPSAARIVYEFYDGPSKMPQYEEMVEAVDRVDSADLTIDEILRPEGWVLLGFIMDPRTGLGRFRDFRVSNYELMEILMEACRVKTINEILAMSDVEERIDIYKKQSELFIDMIKKHTRIEGNVIVSDLRDVNTIYTGNRFIVYSLFPKQNISIWIVDGRAKLNCSIAAGHSIVNRSSKTDVGSLFLKFGGGGHRQVGTCQVPYEIADKVIAELVEKMRQDG